MDGNSILLEISTMTEVVSNKGFCYTIKNIALSTKHGYENLYNELIEFDHVLTSKKFLRQFRPKVDFCETLRTNVQEIFSTAKMNCEDWDAERQYEREGFLDTAVARMEPGDLIKVYERALPESKIRKDTVIDIQAKFQRKKSFAITKKAPESINNFSVLSSGSLYQAKQSKALRMSALFRQSRRVNLPERKNISRDRLLSTEDSQHEQFNLYQKMDREEQ